MDYEGTRIAQIDRYKELRAEAIALMRNAPPPKRGQRLPDTTILRKVDDVTEAYNMIAWVALGNVAVPMTNQAMLVSIRNELGIR